MPRLGRRGADDWTGKTLATIKEREEVAVRRAMEIDLNIEIEIRRRRIAEAEQQPNHIEDHHQSYIAAFPLRQYIYESFPILEPGRVYKNNWHIDAISELLQSATVGDIKNFVINLPRRGMKSSLVCVMWMTWVWTFLPYTRWLFSSFSEKFALRDSESCRKLINSVWYQQRFGEVFQLSRTVNARRKFENTKGGFRACFGVGKGTGDGGDFVIVDDPHQISQAESDKVVETTVEWWHGTMYNSVTDPATAVRGIIHQRVSEKDLTGSIIARELNYQHLCIPMTYEDDHPYKNSISKPFKMGKVSLFEKATTPELVVGEQKLWMDPRDPLAPAMDNKWYRNWYKNSYTSLGLHSSGEGEIMWPNRFTPDIIEEIKNEIEVYGESAQLQQRPIRRGGNFFRSDDFKVAGRPVTLKSLELHGMIYVRVWDKAGSQDKGDWTVGMLMARTAKRPFEIYIIDVVREQVSYYERMKLMKKYAEEDSALYLNNLVDTEYTVLIEREPASSGKDLATLEMDFLQGYHVLSERPKGKKAWRAKPAKTMSEAGRIKACENSKWNLPFFKELERFDPDNEHNQDDQIDTLSAGVKFLIFNNERRKSSSGVR